MSRDHLYCNNPACPPFLSGDTARRAGGVLFADRQAIAGRIRASQRHAVSHALTGLSRHLLRDIGIDLSTS